MSMREYPLIAKKVLMVDAAVAKCIVDSGDIEEALEELQENSNTSMQVHYAVEFFGEADFADESKSYDDKQIVWLDTQYEPHEYDTDDEIIDEYKELLSEYNFPEDLAWKAHICDLEGTFYC